MKNRKDLEVIELIQSYLVDRMRRKCQNNEEYLEAMKKEEGLYERLSDKLTDEQAEELEEYFTASNATFAIMERLAYIQGMKDIISLLKYLS